jgi:hypothetical protein
MKRTLLLLLVTLAMAGPSCKSLGSGPVKPVPPTPCSVPAWPDDPYLEVTLDGCPPGHVCLTESSVIALGIYVRGVIQYYSEAQTCPFLKERS